VPLRQRPQIQKVLRRGIAAIQCVNIPETIRKAIERHGLIPEGARVIAAISGGADSVALLHAFHALGIPVSVAHLNHRLRGADSDADEAFVRLLADELGFPFFSTGTDVKQLAATSGLSIEMAARRARHDFFATFDDATIALAHHADDQVETFLLRLARGAGPEGLGGMPFIQSLQGLRIIRPMLELHRSEVVQWLDENGWAWREDASNQDEQYLRNRVRHAILPLLERELNPNIRQAILRTMDILREESEYVDAASSRVTAGRSDSDATRLEAASTLALPLALQRRIVRKWLFDNGADEAGYDAVEQIISQMDNGAGTTIFELNDRQRVVVEYGQPRFEQKDGPRQDPAWKLTIEAGTGWRKDQCEVLGLLPAEASFDADRVDNAPIEVRSYQPGDRMQPLGGEGSRKLQDIFTDRKIPREQRNRVPVVVCRGEIIWLPGYRIARGWAVDGTNGTSVHVRIEQKRVG
jgi:tRNA(Ile)-lysidine synthase